MMIWKHLLRQWFYKECYLFPSCTNLGETVVSCSRVLSKKTTLQKSAKIILGVLFQEEYLECFPLRKEMGLSQLKKAPCTPETTRTNTILVLTIFNEISLSQAPGMRPGLCCQKIFMLSSFDTLAWTPLNLSFLFFVQNGDYTCLFIWFSLKD